MRELAWCYFKGDGLIQNYSKAFELLQRALEQSPDSAYLKRQLVAEALAVKADAESIRAAVGRLAEPMRTVVVLRYFEEMELVDIARAVSAPLGTVKFRLHHARRELAEMLAQTFREHSASNLTE